MCITNESLEARRDSGKTGGIEPPVRPSAQPETASGAMLLAKGNYLSTVGFRAHGRAEVSSVTPGSPLERSESGVPPLLVR